jgi:hypothetical protein
MGLFSNLAAITRGILQLGLNGPNLKNESGAFAARLFDDSGYAVARGGTPVAASDLCPKSYVDGAMLSAANPTALTALATTTFPHGALANVQHDQNGNAVSWSFYYDPNSTATPDNYFFIPAAGGGNWVRTATAVLVTEPRPETIVFVDPLNNGGSGAPGSSTASDGNDGTSIAKALISGQQYLRRCGTIYPTISQATTITFLSDQPSTDNWLFSPNLVGSGNVNVNGTFTQQGTATIGTFTPRNRVAGTKNTITAVGQSGNYWTQFRGMLCNDTTAGAWFVIDADLGSATAAITEPIVSTFNPTFGAPAYVTIANGDSLVIYTQSKINAAFCSMGAGGFGVVQYQRCRFVGQILQIGNNNGYIRLNECRLDAVFQPYGSLGFCKNNHFSTSSSGLISGVFFAGSFSSSSLSFSVPPGTVTPSTDLDGDILVNSAWHPSTHMRFGRVYLASGGDLDLPGAICELGAADLPGLYYPDCELWGAGAFDVDSGASLRMPTGVTAANAMLLTGGFTIDGASTAYPWVPGSNAYGAAVAITGANVDTNKILTNPASGSLICKGSV